MKTEEFLDSKIDLAGLDIFYSGSKSTINKLIKILPSIIANDTLIEYKRADTVSPIYFKNEHCIRLINKKIVKKISIRDVVTVAEVITIAINDKIESTKLNNIQYEGWEAIEYNKDKSIDELDKELTSKEGVKIEIFN